MSTSIVTECQDRVLHIRLARPEKKNALSTEMYQALAEAIEAAGTDPEVRALLFTGTDGCFCSGNDIGDFLQNPAKDENHPVLLFMRALAACPKPVVAGVRGPAVGVGVTMLLHCDLIYAAPNARFSMPFVNLGICAEFASSYLLPRMVGHARAAEILLLGEPFGAQQALDYGMINAIIDDEAVEAHSRDMARKLAQKAPNAMRVTKDLLKRWSGATVQEAIREEAALFMPMLEMPEAREAFTAFMQKRQPDFSQFS